MGVIADCAPAHFPSDSHALSHFDGTALYEHADPRLGRHLDWDTLIYNCGRCLGNDGRVAADAGPAHGRAASLSLTPPALATLVLLPGI